MSEEKPAGLIPRLIVRNVLVAREYAILVTDKRSIFILESDSKRTTLLPGVQDYEQQDPELLATDPKNFMVPHSYLEKIEVKREGRSPYYKFNMEYKTQEGKGREVKGQLVPPGEPSSRRKQDSASEDGANHEYAKMAREVYQKALPPMALEALTEWDL